MTPNRFDVLNGSKGIYTDLPNLFGGLDGGIGFRYNWNSKKQKNWELRQRAIWLLDQFEAMYRDNFADGTQINPSLPQCRHALEGMLSQCWTSLRERGQLDNADWIKVRPTFDKT